MVRSISTAFASTKVVVASQTPARDSQTGAYCASALPQDLGLAVAEGAPRDERDGRGRDRQRGQQ